MTELFQLRAAIDKAINEEGVKIEEGGKIKEGDKEEDKLKREEKK